MAQQQHEPTETVLVVDDEDSVRRTFLEWLAEAGLGCQVVTASDAEEALRQASRHTIDLAILDWNLGAGDNGLDLLQDLREFNPDVAAIMVTAFANRATPLDAMRMGVRDYLDKNQDLSRRSFLETIEKQLRTIRPAKRERQLHHSLTAFREAVEKVLPLVQSAAAVTDPVSLPEVIGGLFRFLLEISRARDGVLFVRHYDPQRQPTETCRVYDAAGQLLTAPLVPFARSVAATAVSLEQPCAMKDLEQAEAAGTLELQPFEKGRASLLASPLALTPELHVVLELFDKMDERGELDPAGFSAADQRLVGAAGAFGAEMLRQALAQRQTHQVLFDAVAAALGATRSVTETLHGDARQRLEEPPPAPVLEQLREGFRAVPSADISCEDSLRLAEAIRVLSLRYGPPAVQHCVRLIEDLRATLDAVTGS
jgi:two-component system nitrogen regulation response regulator NtrX